MHSGLAALRILTGQMLNVVLRPVRDLTAMNPHRPVTVHAPDLARASVRRFGYGHLLPAPFVLAVDEVFAALLAPKHEVMGHFRMALGVRLKVRPDPTSTVT